MKLLTIPEAAARNRVCRKTLDRLIDAGKGPPVILVGKRKFIDEDDNAAWLASLRRQAVAA